MINQEKFYEIKDYPDSKTKNKIWGNISKSIETNNAFRGRSLDIRSFAFGAAFTFVIFIVSIIILKTIPALFEQSKPEDQLINEAYYNMLNELELRLPKYLNTVVKTEKTQEILSAKLNQLEHITVEINKIRSGSNMPGSSVIIASRLRNLYLMKLDVINDILELKEGQYL